MVSSKSASQSTRRGRIEKRCVSHHRPRHSEPLAFLTIELQFQLIKCQKQSNFKYYSQATAVHTPPPPSPPAPIIPLPLNLLPSHSLSMASTQIQNPFSQIARASRQGAPSQPSGLMTLTEVPILEGSQDLSRQQIGQPDGSRELKESPGDPTYAAAPAAAHNSPLPHNNASWTSQEENCSMVQSQLEVDMTEDINKYFERCANSIAQFEDYRDRFVLVSNHKIKKMIRRGELEVSEQSEQLRLGRDRTAREAEARRRAVEEQKYEIIRKLKTIEREEVDLVHRAIREGRNRSVEMKKIDFTAEERERVAGLLKAQREFERALRQKTDDYIRNKEHLKQAQADELRRAQEAENARKKEEIGKRLREMELKTSERKELLKNSALKVPHTYIHNQLEKKYKSLQKISEQETESKLREISQRHRLNIEQINEHDRRYSELLERRSQSLSRLRPVAETKRYEPTYFTKVVDEELFEIKERNYQRLMKVKENQYKNKINNYQELIDQNHRPKPDPAKTIAIPIPRAYSSVSLSKEERDQKGLQYLAKAKEMKRSTSEVADPPKETQNYGYSAYKDYLKERESSNVDATAKELKEIMLKKDQTDYSSLLRAKFLAEGLEAKSKKGKDDKLYFSAKTKLSLLSQLY